MLIFILNLRSTTSYKVYTSYPCGVYVWYKINIFLQYPQIVPWSIELTSSSGSLQLIQMIHKPYKIKVRDTSTLSKQSGFNLSWQIIFSNRSNPWEWQTRNRITYLILHHIIPESNHIMDPSSFYLTVIIWVHILTLHQLCLLTFFHMWCLPYGVKKYHHPLPQHTCTYL